MEGTVTTWIELWKELFLFQLCSAKSLCVFLGLYLFRLMIIDVPLPFVEMQQDTGFSTLGSMVNVFQQLEVWQNPQPGGGWVP